MKTILDLLREFVTLNDGKIIQGGKLPPESEQRWAELKKFYDVLMGSNGVSGGNVTRRFAVAEIREGLPRREHLRVPLVMDLVFEHEDQYHTGKVMNLSCGGLFLVAETVLVVGSRLTLYLSNVGRGTDAVMTIEGEVAWNSGTGEAQLPRGMGIRFVNVPDNFQDKLDSFVVEVLEKHFCGLSRDLLDPDFLRNEGIEH